MVNAVDWLQPLHFLLPDLNGDDWAALGRLDAQIDRLTATGPATDPAIRAAFMLEVRRRLAAAGYATLTLPAAHGGAGRPAALQALAQFVCGWHDLDLRDATGLGHGAMVLGAISPAMRDRWLSRLAAGDLVGIAATERHGGSRIQEITTRATLTAGGRWLVSGEKVWVSRLAEAAGLVVFFRDPDGRITAAIIGATAPGLNRKPIRPAGLAGWSWGVLGLHQVPVDPSSDLIGAPGAGLNVFRKHFTRFRPLATATALGTAAGVHTAVAETLAARVRAGVLPRVRDNALITLGRTHASLTAALLGTLATVRLGDISDPRADLWARIGKAQGVDTALAAVDELVPLTGAAGFTADSPLAKARADLAALQYADGIHDSLYRSGGKTLLGAYRLQAATVTTLPVPAEPGTVLPASA
jgi:alkylation response protein AidB-like acyl-CoA dehydrogenase